MRAFIGIKLEERTQKYFKEFLEPFKEISTPLRWVETERLHLTLKYLGEISLEQLDQIIYVLMNVKSTEKYLEINFQGFGKFGKGDQVNILWVGIKKDESLVALFNTIDMSLHMLGFDRETRTFEPHLTIARSKKQFSFKSFISILEENNNKIIHKMKIKSFQIFKSSLTPTGPVYSIIKEIPIDQS